MTGASPLERPRARPRAILLGAGLAALLLVCVFDTARCRIWANDLTLFTHAQRRDPFNPNKTINCAAILVDFGQVQEAYDLLQTYPNPGVPFHNQVEAECLFHLGRPQEAVALLEAALDWRPPHTGVHVLLAQWLIARGDLDRAEAVLRAGAKLDRNDFRIPALLAEIVSRES